MPTTTTTAWTLDVDGTEKTAARWGIERTNFKRAKREQAASTLSFSVPMAGIDAAAPFSAGQIITVYRGRRINPDGISIVANSGTRWFYGEIRTVRRMMEPGNFRWIITARDTWYWFEQANFQQKVLGSTGTEVFTSDVLVPFKRGATTFSVLTTDQQITEVLTYLKNDVIPPVPLTIGTIALAPGGFAGGTVPMRNYTDPKCAEVMKHMFLWSPDAIGWIDDETNPSTFHARRWADLPAVTLPLGPTVQVGRLVNGRIVSVEIEPLNDLVASHVFFRFRKFNEVNGKTRAVFTEQAWPAGATGRERRCVTDTFDLDGFRKTVLRSEVVTGSLDCKSANNTTLLNWWRANDSVLSNPRLTDLTITNVRIFTKDGAGNKVELTDIPYPRELLLDSEITDWMEADGVAWQEIEVQCNAAFKRWKDDAHTELEPGGDLITLNTTIQRAITGVIATNAITKTYSSSAVTQQQEPEPLGLARWFWTAASVLHYAGSIVITDRTIADRVKIGQRLNLSGGLAAWLTMNALVTSIEDDVGNGTTTVTFGPPKFLGAHELVQYLKINRLQGRRSTSAGTAQTGLADAGTSIRQGNVRARKNSTSVSGGGGGGVAVWG